jgi:hypothetical protein
MTAIIFIAFGIFCFVGAISILTFARDNLDELQEE